LTGAAFFAVEDFFAAGFAALAMVPLFVAGVWVTARPISDGC
jgi:hypothetical protein